MPESGTSPEPTAAAEISPATGELLDLQKMEAALVRANLARPDVLDRPVYERLRYLLAFARLTRFQPGAARAGRRLDGVADLDLNGHVAPFRARTLAALRRPLREERDPARRLREAAAQLDRLGPELEDVRDALTKRRGPVKRADLDAECGTKTLVGISGGGGGAGYVYVGAFRELERNGIVPSYLVGASIGAVLGCFRARAVPGRWQNWIEIAERLDGSTLFTRPRDGRRYGLPGMLGLNLEAAIGPTMSDEAGRRLRLDELAMPFDIVVAGVRRRSFERLPERFRRTGRAGERPARAPGRIAAGVAVRMWQVAAFVDPRIVKAVTLGADPLTGRLAAVHAAGFSASIPGVLHYDVPRADRTASVILSELFEREEVAALIDGGAASNVPAEQAWRQVQAGRIGTRNAVFLAFDCFTPSWDPRHLWLQPIVQGVGLQMNRNARFADWIVRFDQALSPVTLVPGPEKLGQAINWGAEAVSDTIPMLNAMLEPVGWDR